MTYVEVAMEALEQCHRDTIYRQAMEAAKEELLARIAEYEGLEKLLLHIKKRSKQLENVARCLENLLAREDADP